MKFADLHAHTLFSDGTCTPEELIAQARQAGLSAIAVVDHDTVGGLKEAEAAARASRIELIPGIELSTETDGQEAHILGYLIDYRKKDLVLQLEEIRQDRLARIHKILKKLKGMGKDLEAKEVLAMVGGGTVGRLHIARAMLKSGLVGTTQEAFKKYIGDKCPAYVAGFRFSPKEAIKIIKEAGGVAVLAHPYTLHKDELLEQIISDGIMGLEAYYPEHSQSMVNFYLGLARENDLLVTGGSDFHGSAKPQVKLGSTKIPYDLVEKLKAAKPAYPCLSGRQAPGRPERH